MSLLRFVAKPGSIQISACLLGCDFAPCMCTFPRVLFFYLAGFAFRVVVSTWENGQYFDNCLPRSKSIIIPPNATECHVERECSSMTLAR